MYCIVLYHNYVRGALLPYQKAFMSFRLHTQYGVLYLMAGVPDPPTDLNATQVGPTSIRVFWTAPVLGATVTGYRISYSGGTDQGSVDVGASATEHTITITQPQSRLTYSISIVTLSSQLSSSMAGPIMVTVGTHNV